LKIVGSVDVEPGLDAHRVQTLRFCTAQGFAQHLWGAPGHVFEQVPMGAVQADEVIPTILGGAQDDIVPRLRDYVEGTLEIRGRQCRGVAIDGQHLCKALAEKLDERRQQTASEVWPQLGDEQKMRWGEILEKGA
jgi:hypothetical protein